MDSGTTVKWDVSTFYASGAVKPTSLLAEKTKLLVHKTSGKDTQKKT